MSNIIFSNKEESLKILENIKKDGVFKLHLLADFDNTLTRAYVDGKKSSSMVAILRSDEKALGEECAIKDSFLFDKYHPIEFDSKIDISEKKIKMNQWWDKSLSLFIEYGLSLDLLENIAKTNKIQLRDYTDELLNKLNSNKIPLVIISASGFGKKSIDLYLKYRGLMFDNIDIISNDFIFNDKGIAISFKKPVIHSFNKDETVMKNFPEIYDKIKNRKNIILLGDSLGDHHMSDGFDYNNILKIGFLNYREEENLEAYKERYDIIVTGDGDMSFINEFLNNILT